MDKIKLFIFTLIVAVAFTAFSVAYASDAITIDSVVFGEYVDEYGAVDKSLVSVKVGYTAVTVHEQMSLLLTSEDITEISDTTKSKIIYMTQENAPEDGFFEFVIEKSKIESATGLADINGCTLFIKIGGKSISDMVTDTITYTDPYMSKVIPGDVDGDMEVTNLDGTYLLRYLADWQQDNIQPEAMDVDDDGEITNLDGTFLLRYLAGWDIELK